MGEKRGLEELEEIKSVIASVRDLRAVIESDLKGAIKSRTVDCRHSNYRVIPHTDMGDPVESEGGTGLVKVLPRAVTMLLTKSLCC